MACCHRGNAILTNLHASGWRSRAPSLIDFLLQRKEGQERWSFVKNPWCFHACYLAVCKTARISSPHRHPCLVPVFCSLLVSGPESNISLNVQRNLLYFSVICVLAWAPWCCFSSPVSCSDNESLSLHLAISCFPFFTPMMQQKEFIRRVKCLTIIREGKNKFSYFWPWRSFTSHWNQLFLHLQ